MYVKKTMAYLQKSFWFIPGMFALFPFILFFCLFSLATPNVSTSGKFSIFTHVVDNPETIRTILRAIAAATISIVSISFSITILVLSIASQQYSPRLLQDFMRKNDTKVILGIFIATFIYCLITIGVADEGTQYKGVIVILTLIGLMLGVLSLMAFIYFINYVVQAISLGNIIHHVEDDIIDTLKKYYPSATDENDASAVLPPATSMPYRLVVLAKETGYLVSVDYEKLAEEALKHGCVLNTLYLPGNFIIEKSPLCEITYTKAESSDALIAVIEELFFINSERTVGDDILYPINQLVDIAVKALSPGINDPKTAINCIDSIAKIIGWLAGRLPMPAHIEAEEKVCVTRPIYTYADLLKYTYRVIYDHSKTNRVVLCHLVETIAKLITIPSSEMLRENLLQEANIILLHNELSAFDKEDLVAIFTKLTIPSPRHHAGH